jgi:Mn-containing catalase
MSNRNDITGDKLINKRLSKEGEDNWDRIFKKQGITLTEEELANVEIIADIVQHHHNNKKLPEYELDKSTGEVVKVDSKKLTDAYNGH